MISGSYYRRIITIGSKHLTTDEHYSMSQILSEQQSFKAIGAAIGKNCTTISREIKNHMTFCETGDYGQVYNACLH
ncbi:MAG: helix-turn-helix domain-containing protein [Ruminococcus sp.]